MENQRTECPCSAHLRSFRLDITPLSFHGIRFFCFLYKEGGSWMRKVRVKNRERKNQCAISRLCWSVLLGLYESKKGERYQDQRLITSFRGISDAHAGLHLRDMDVVDTFKQIWRTWLLHTLSLATGTMFHSATSPVAQVIWDYTLFHKHNNIVKHSYTFRFPRK